MTTRKEGYAGPIKLELETRLIAKSAEVNRLASSLPELVQRGFAARSQPDAIVHLQERMASVRCVLEEVEELVDLLIPPLPVMSESERSQALHAAQSGLLAEGFSPLETLESLRVAQRKPHGRPATKRHLAVIALDKWLTNPRISWPRITREVCNCGEQTHGPACHERLRQQVNDLRSVLRRLGIQEPARKAAH